jgi:crotonobetainyl-CoA:carnitine CoA-transferase CaiB-like acyl-CoA transferase
MSTNEENLVNELWRGLQGTRSMPVLTLAGPARLLPSPFHVDVLATASIALATACAASLWSERTGQAARAISVDRRHAAAAFRSERYTAIPARATPPSWDPIAGDYETRDGFIRLHTNYRAHRDAVLNVLGVPAERAAVAKAVRSWDAEALEQRIVAASGCAAMLRERAAYQAHAQGVAIASEPLFAISNTESDVPAFPSATPAPLAGIRVLDLTRVIAGPVCTRFLSAHGADVLRIDPPDFDEVPALLPDTTMGKRRAVLDLREASHRETFKRLIAEAHVLVIGYRSDALDRLGLGAALCAQLNPGLVTVRLDAYGFGGPWATRRGFDSLVQMSSGIAARGRAWKGCREPYPLPAQALDHASGYLAAAAVCHGLTLALTKRTGSETRLSLAGSAELLWQLGTDDLRDGRELSEEEVAPYLESADSPWGPAQRLSCPGAIEGYRPRWTLPVGPLGCDAPTFAQRAA